MTSKHDASSKTVKYNEIQQVAIWRETLKREKASQRVCEDFTLHPKNVYDFPENPMRKKDERRLAARTLDPGFEG
jgi:hypothetical protein